MLVVPNWTRVSDALAAHDVLVDPGALQAADAHARRDIDLGLGGKASDQQRGWAYFNLVLRHAGIEISNATDAALAELQRYHNKQNLWEQVVGGVPATLELLKAMGLKLVVVSNANGRLPLLFDRLDLTKHFDVILDSAIEGVEKPNPRLFQIALERAGADPASTIHVGDLYHVDVEGARSAGLRALLLDEADLYAGFACARIRHISELPDIVAGRRTVEWDGPAATTSDAPRQPAS